MAHIDRDGRLIDDAPTAMTAAAGRKAKRVGKAAIRAGKAAKNLTDDWRYDYHDPGTGRFAPKGYVTPTRLAGLLSKNAKLRAEVATELRDKLDGQDGLITEYARALRSGDEGAALRLARQIREAVIGPPSDERGWKAANTELAKALRRAASQRRPDRQSVGGGRRLQAPAAPGGDVDLPEPIRRMVGSVGFSGGDDHEYRLVRRGYGHYELERWDPANANAPVERRRVTNAESGENLDEWGLATIAQYVATQEGWKLGDEEPLVIYKADPVRVSSAQEALDLILDGQHVEMDETTFATTLSELARIGRDASAKGVDAPDYDLCLVHVPDTNIFCDDTVGWERVEMPQLGGFGLRPGSYAARKLARQTRGMSPDERKRNAEVDLTSEFVEFLSEQGVDVEDRTVSPSLLKATQSQLKGGQVGQMMAAAQDKGFDFGGNPIFVSSDGYILDGHHRWAAQVGLQYVDGKEMEMKVRRVDMPIQQLLEVANSWTLKHGVLPQSSKPRTPKNVVDGELVERDVDAFADERARLAAELAEAARSVPGKDQPRARYEYLTEHVGSLGGTELDTERIYNHLGPEAKDWDAARSTHHYEIVDEFLSAAERLNIPKERRALLLGGLPGAGKSSALAPGGAAASLGVRGFELGGSEDGEFTHIVISSDIIKEMMLRRGMVDVPEGIDPMEMVGVIHEESSVIASQLEEALLASGYNVIHDYTLGNTKGVRKRAAHLMDAGYAKPDLLMIDIPVEESVESNFGRYARGFSDPLGGRLVPEAVIRKSATDSGARSRNVDAMIEALAEGLIGNGMWVDNTGVSARRPRGDVLARIENGQLLDVESDAELIDRLLSDAEGGGGWTLDPGSRRFPEQGWAVGRPGHSAIMDAALFQSDEQEARRFIRSFLAKLRDDGDDDAFVGAWFDRDNNEIVLDRVDVVSDRSEAERLGRDRGEQGIANVATGEYVDTGGDGGRDAIERFGSTAPPSDMLVPEPVTAHGKEYELAIVSLRAAVADLPTDPEERWTRLQEIFANKVHHGAYNDAVHNHLGPDGTDWSDERMAVHDRIIDSALARVEELGIPKGRDVVVFGGLPGSGKSSSLAPGGPAESMNVSAFEVGAERDGASYTHVSVNSDLFKDILFSEGLYESVEGLSPREAASMVHDESSTIARVYERRLLELGYNVVFDGTMTKPDSTRRQLGAAREWGYGRARFLFADVPIEESVISAKKRYIAQQAEDPLGGRIVPEAYVYGSRTDSGHKSKNRDALDVLIAEGWFESGMVIDNTGIADRKPRKEVSGRFEDGRWTQNDGPVFMATVESTERPTPTEVARLVNDARDAGIPLPDQFGIRVLLDRMDRMSYAEGVEYQRWLREQGRAGHEHYVSKAYYKAGVAAAAILARQEAAEMDDSTLLRRMDAMAGFLSDTSQVYRGHLASGTMNYIALRDEAVGRGLLTESEAMDRLLGAAQATARVSDRVQRALAAAPKSPTSVAEARRVLNRATGDVDVDIVRVDTDGWTYMPRTTTPAERIETLKGAARRNGTVFARVGNAEGLRRFSAGDELELRWVNDRYGATYLTDPETGRRRRLLMRWDRLDAFRSDDPTQSVRALYAPPSALRASVRSGPQRLRLKDDRLAHLGLRAGDYVIAHNIDSPVGEVRASVFVAHPNAGLREYRLRYDRFDAVGVLDANEAMVEADVAVAMALGRPTRIRVEQAIAAIEEARRRGVRPRELVGLADQMLDTRVAEAAARGTDGTVWSTRQRDRLQSVVNGEPEGTITSAPWDGVSWAPDQWPSRPPAAAGEFEGPKRPLGGLFVDADGGELAPNPELVESVSTARTAALDALGDTRVSTFDLPDGTPPLAGRAAAGRAAAAPVPVPEDILVDYHRAALAALNYPEPYDSVDEVLAEYERRLASGIEDATDFAVDMAAVRTDPRPPQYYVDVESRALDAFKRLVVTTFGDDERWQAMGVDPADVQGKGPSPKRMASAIAGALSDLDGTGAAAHPAIARWRINRALEGLGLGRRPPNMWLGVLDDLVYGTAMDPGVWDKKGAYRGPRNARVDLTPDDEAGIDRLIAAGDAILTTLEESLRDGRPTLGSPEMRRYVEERTQPAIDEATPFIERRVAELLPVAEGELAKVDKGARIVGTPTITTSGTLEVDVDFDGGRGRVVVVPANRTFAVSVVRPGEDIVDATIKHPRRTSYPEVGPWEGAWHVRRREEALADRDVAADPEAAVRRLVSDALVYGGLGRVPGVVGEVTFSEDAIEVVVDGERRNLTSIRYPRFHRDGEALERLWWNQLSRESGARGVGRDVLGAVYETANLDDLIANGTWTVPEVGREARAAIAEVASMLPKALVEAAGPLEFVTLDDRRYEGQAWYKPLMKRIELGSGTFDPAVVIHEVGHHLEGQALGAAGWAYLTRRTGGVRTPVAGQLTGGRRDDGGRPDEFYVGYSGKTYGDMTDLRGGDHNGVVATEVFSTALEGWMEWLTGSRRRHGAPDREHMAWALGVLLMGAESAAEPVTPAE